jgi:hypothetical protein
MRQILLSHKDIKKIAAYTSQYYQSIAQYPLSAYSVRAIQYIVARDYLSRHSAKTNTVFDPSALPALQVYLRALDSHTASTDTVDVHDQELAGVSECDANSALKPAFLDAEALLSLFNTTESQTGEDQSVMPITGPLPDVESDQLDDEAVFPIFDRKALEALYEQSSLYDKEIRRIIKSIDENDTGFRQLQRVTPEAQARILSLKAKYPNMLPFLDFIDKHAALSAHNKHQEFYLPPVLLVSKPGLGKTACVKDVALALGLPFDFVDYSTASAAWILVGVSSVWSSAKPGLIFNQLINSNRCNGLILCDEIDKSPDKDKYPPLNVFYQLLEKDMMRDFQDEFLPQLKLDASRMMFVATANSTDTIPEAILSRFHVINISQPSPSQLRVIASSIYRSILEAESYRAFAATLSDDVIDCLLDFSPRQTKVLLKLAFSNAAYRCRHDNKLEPGSIHIEPDDIDFAEVEPETRQPMGYIWH